MTGACRLDKSDVQPNEHTVWHTVLKEVSVDAHSENIFSIDSENKINETTSTNF